MSDLAREHEASLYAMAVRMSRDPGEARDLVQDTFERALKKLDQFELGTNSRAWLITILHNLFIDRCRRRAREPIVEPIEQHDLVASVDVEAAPAWTNFTGDQLKAALVELGDDFRKVYELHAIEQRSYEEIAKTLGIPKATVGTRLIRARRKLKDILVKNAGGAPGGES